MITIFNRRELKVTDSKEIKNCIIEILINNNIEYRLHTVNRLTGNGIGEIRSRTGLVGQMDKEMDVYTIFVKKENYEEARWLINNNKNF